MPKDKSAAHKGTKHPPPPRPVRSGGLIFVGVFIVVSIAIGSIVLLANDHRNLRALLRSLDIDWLLSRQTTPSIPPLPIAKTHVAVDRIGVPHNALSDISPNALSGFARELPAIAPQLCAAFANAGFNNDGWKGSPYGASGYECISERKFPPEADTQDASVFFMLKGEQNGAISSLRFKLVAPETSGGRQAHAALLQAIKLLISQTGWNDLTGLLTAARNLKDYSADYLGLSLEFQREFTSPDRFNLIITPTNRDPAVERTRDFFRMRDALKNGESNQPKLGTFAPRGMRPIN